MITELIVYNTVLLVLALYALASLFFSNRSIKSRVVFGGLYLMPLVSAFLRIFPDVSGSEASRFLLYFYVVIITLSQIREFRFDCKWRLGDVYIKDQKKRQQALRCLRCPLSIDCKRDPKSEESCSGSCVPPEKSA